MSIYRVETSQGGVVYPDTVRQEDGLDGHEIIIPVVVLDGRYTIEDLEKVLQWAKETIK